MVFGRKAPGVQTVVYRQVWAELYASIGINTAQVTAGVNTGVLQRKKREDCLWYSFRQESTGKSKWASNGANMTLPQSWTKFVVWRQSTFRLSPQNRMHWKPLCYFSAKVRGCPRGQKGLEGTASPGATSQAIEQAEPLKQWNGVTRLGCTRSAQAEANQTEQGPSQPCTNTYTLSFYCPINGSGLRQSETTQNSGRQRDHVTDKQMNWKVFLNTTPREKEGDAILIIPLNINYKTATFKLEHIPLDNWIKGQENWTTFKALHVSDISQLR